MGQKFILSLENERIWIAGELHCLLRSPVWVREIGLRLHLTWCLEQLHWLLISLLSICTSNWLPPGDWLEEPCDKSQPQLQAVLTSSRIDRFGATWIVTGTVTMVQLKWKLKITGYTFAGSWGFQREELAPGLGGIRCINSLCILLHFVLNSNKPVTFLKTYHEEERFVITTLGFGNKTGFFLNKVYLIFETEKKSNFSRFP